MPGKPEVVVPRIPGSVQAFTVDGEVVCVHFYPVSGTAYMYAGCNLLAVESDVLCMTEVSAQLWIIGVLCAL